MKNTRYAVVRVCSVVVAAGILWLLSGEALAAETGGDWRPTYDLVMRYVNFLILLFLILKYARKPLVNFFKGKSEDVKNDIQKIEEAKQAIENQVKALLKERDRSREKFNLLKERIIAQGQTKKQSIIDDAKQEGRLLVQNAQHKITHQISTARRHLRAEMVDMAVDLAMERLPQQITDQDNQRLLDQYLESTRSLEASA